MTANEITLDHGTGCHVTPFSKVVSQEQLSQAATALLLVRGMGCPTCALRVRNGLLQIDGVLAADVVLSSSLARVWYDPGVVQPDFVASAMSAFAGDGKHHYTAHLLEAASLAYTDDHASSE